jgi:hypothetical protein
VLLGKLPAIREFMTATAYDDGTPRTPGYFTVRNRVIAFELTLYDPDSGSRLVVRSPAIDTMWQMAEQLLGTEEAPWEPDGYLMDQLSKRGKKKK